MKINNFYRYEEMDNSTNFRATLSIEFRDAINTHYSFNGWTSKKPLPMFAENTTNIERILAGLLISSFLCERTS